MKVTESYSSQPLLRPTERFKSVEEKLEELKQNFSHNAVKVDFLRKSDGFNYVLGYVGLTEDNAEWRIWKSIGNISKSDEYLHTFKNADEARVMFKSVIEEDYTSKSIEKDQVEKARKKKKKKKDNNFVSKDSDYPAAQDNSSDVEAAKNAEEKGTLAKE